MKNTADATNATATTTITQGELFLLPPLPCFLAHETSLLHLHRWNLLADMTDHNQEVQEGSALNGL
jgi:hypothetical protein